MSDTPIDPLWTIDATLVSRGFTLERPPLVYRGPLRVHGIEIAVEIDVPDVAFVAMPRVKITDASGLPIKRLAHVLDEGGVCYFGQGGLPLDMYDPGGSVLRVLEEAAAALERSFAGGAKAEFEAELASYWRGNSLFVAISRGGAPEIVEAELVGLLSSPKSGIAVVPKGQWQDAGERLGPACVLTFASDLQHSASFPPDTLAAVIKYVAAQPKPPPRWREVILQAASEGMPVFLSAPNAIIGWGVTLPPILAATKARTRGFRPSFLPKAIQRAPETVTLDRKVGLEVDLRQCVERNLLGQPSLIGKSVTLIGCGTIGGYLARLLAQSGAGCGALFTLYDTDRLSPGNIGRHALGVMRLGQNKALAVAEWLHTDFHPDVDARGIDTDAVRAWSEIAKSDLVIDATGEQNVSTALNHLFMQMPYEGAPTLLHTWVFGNGVAAQSFLNLRDQGACYRCLKTDFAGQWRVNPLRDTKAEQIHAAARCGEAGYVPFAADAPSAAANLALRAAIDWAGDQPGQHLRTTVLDQKAGRERVPWASPERLPRCLACGTG